jgi:hypothetical protein
MFPYDSNFPDHFGKLGTGRYDGSDPHNIGEIWAATLMEMNRRTARHFGFQLVMDEFQLTPANPSFLVARDAILLALDGLKAAGRINESQRAGAWQGIWSAFVKFGMGPQAASNGAQLTGIVADFSMGQQNWRWCKKCQGLYFAGNPGSKCPASGGHVKTGSGNYKLIFNAWGVPGAARLAVVQEVPGPLLRRQPGLGLPGGWRPRQDGKRGLQPDVDVDLRRGTSRRRRAACTASPEPSMRLDPGGRDPQCADPYSRTAGWTAPARTHATGAARSSGPPLRAARAQAQLIGTRLEHIPGGGWSGVELRGVRDPPLSRRRLDSRHRRARPPLTRNEGVRGSNPRVGSLAFAA